MVTASLYDICAVVSAEDEYGVVPHPLSLQLRHDLLYPLVQPGQHGSVDVSHGVVRPL